MIKQSIRGRLSDLEAKSGLGDKPMITAFQDIDDREVYHVGGRQSDQVMTWPEVEKEYKEHIIFRVVYDDNYRDPDRT